MADDQGPLADLGDIALARVREAQAAARRRLNEAQESGRKRVS